MSLKDLFSKSSKKKSSADSFTLPSNANPLDDESSTLGTVDHYTENNDVFSATEDSSDNFTTELSGEHDLTELDELSRSDSFTEMTGDPFSSDSEPISRKTTSKLGSFLRKRNSDTIGELSSNDMPDSISELEDANEDQMEFSSMMEDRKGASRTEARTNPSYSDNNTYIGQRKLPVIGKWAVKTQYQLAVGVGILGVLGLIGGGVAYTDATTREASTVQVATKLFGQFEKVDKFFSAAVLGRAGGLDGLNANWSEVQKEFKKVEAYNKEFSGEAAENVAVLEGKINTRLAKITKDIDTINYQKDFLTNSASRVNSIANDVNNLSDTIDSLGVIYAQLGANNSEMTNIYFLRNTLQNLNGVIAKLLLSEEFPAETVPELSKSKQDFRKAMQELYYGDNSKNVSSLSYGTPYSSYNDLANKWVHFSDTVETIIKSSPDLMKIRSLAPVNSVSLKDLSSDMQSLVALYDTYDYQGVSTARNIILLSALLLAFAALVTFYVYTFEKDNRNALEKVENNRNQTSILRLLNEMMPLQDGDLTKKTTVTEEITGAIADSINATIDSLVSLVKKIKDTSFVMREKTGEVNVISLDMLKANAKQSNELQQTGNAVIKISQAITEISEKTESGAAAAEQSVKVSEQGAQQVYASVQSMQQINHNMNDTVRLMKKVGDSSKQISEIVELLSDITEETSILALNATVQAAKAGEAGKGFKIVSDSIQQLADKAANATRSVGALIAQVQTDIQSVGEAINKTTDEVEKGVGLSELAGQSLNQITEVSNSLAEIVSVISEDAKKHAETSQRISENMQMILRLNQENQKSTEKTAFSITEIAEISNELGDSVQSFKVD